MKGRTDEVLKRKDGLVQLACRLKGERVNVRWPGSIRGATRMNSRVETGLVWSGSKSRQAATWRMLITTTYGITLEITLRSGSPSAEVMTFQNLSNPKSLSRSQGVLGKVQD